MEEAVQDRRGDDFIAHQQRRPVLAHLARGDADCPALEWERTWRKEKVASSHEGAWKPISSMTTERRSAEIPKRTKLKTSLWPTQSQAGRMQRLQAEKSPPDSASDHGCRVA